MSDLVALAWPLDFTPPTPRKSCEVMVPRCQWGCERLCLRNKLVSDFMRELFISTTAALVILVASAKITYDDQSTPYTEWNFVSKLMEISRDGRVIPKPIYSQTNCFTGGFVKEQPQLSNPSRNVLLLSAAVLMNS